MVQLSFVLADSYRQEVLEREGKVLPREQQLPLPLAELSASSRRILTEINPHLKETVRLRIPEQEDASPKRYQPEDWESSFIPSSPGDWDRLLSLFEEDRATREQHNREVQHERLDEYRAKLQDVLAQPDGPYSSPYFPGTFSIDVSKSYADYAGYEEALALEQAVRERKAAYAQQKEQEKREQEQSRQEAKERREQEKVAWIKQYGSISLQKKFAAGYDCQRPYVRERASVEYPGYVVDFDDDADWKERSTPSDQAFEEAERVGGTVVWLTAPPRWGNEEEEEPYFEKGEAIVIRDYLGKYDLVRQM